jgi:hypothetical protein
LADAIKNAVDPAKEKKDIKAFLNGKELADALASSNQEIVAAAIAARALS